MKHRFLHIALNIAVLLASSSTLLAAEIPATPKPDPILGDPLPDSDIGRIVCAFRQNLSGLDFSEERP
jgi:hypothetical protein